MCAQCTGIARLSGPTRFTSSPINHKTREREELSRLHLATVEALATAIDAKDQTIHIPRAPVQIYAEGWVSCIAVLRSNWPR